MSSPIIQATLKTSKMLNLTGSDGFLSTGYAEPVEVLLQPNKPTCVRTGMGQGHVQFLASSGTNDTSEIKYIVMRYRKLTNKNPRI